jgi:hypothetical protein
MKKIITTTAAVMAISLGFILYAFQKNRIGLRPRYYKGVEIKKNEKGQYIYVFYKGADRWIGTHRSFREGSLSGGFRGGGPGAGK